VAYALIFASVFATLFGIEHAKDSFMPIRLAGFAALMTGLILALFTYIFWEVIK